VAFTNDLRAGTLNVHPGSTFIRLTVDARARSLNLLADELRADVCIRSPLALQSTEHLQAILPRSSLAQLERSFDSFDGHLERYDRADQLVEHVRLE
jgi:hypothetical protein